MKYTWIRAFLAALNKYGGIPFAVLWLIALGVLFSLVSARPPAESIQGDQQSVGDPRGDNMPTSGGTTGESADYDRG